MSRQNKQTLYVLAALALFAVLWSVQGRLTALRETYSLNPTVEDPVEVIPVLVLGGLRGVVVDFLWIRALARAEQKRYFEIKPIVDLIAHLQPTIPDVWMFQGWNMAYNIATDMHGKEVRWKWVKAGLDYLERGMAKNPDNAEMRAYLAHMYMHRFSPLFFAKDYKYFRRQLARSHQDNYELAVKWYREALKRKFSVWRRAVIARRIPYAYAAAGKLAREEGRWRDAFRYYRKCLQEWDAYRRSYPAEFSQYLGNYLNALSEFGYACYLAGEAARKQGRLRTARRRYAQAAALYEEVLKKWDTPLTHFHKRAFESVRRRLRSLRSITR